MKRIYYLITTLSILLVGCTQDDTFRVGMDDVISFSQAKVTTVDAPTTRAHLDNDMVMVWDDTDAIGIYSDNSAVVTKFTNAGEYTFESETPVTGSQFYAFYPYSANAIDRNDNTVMHYSLPGSYQYDSENYYTSSMPLVSQSTNNSFIFQLTTGMLHFTLWGKQHVTSIELKGNNSERLWGAGTVKVDSNEPVFVLDDEEADAYNTVVTLNMDLEMEEDDVKDFFFVVPVGTYEKGFTITLGIIDEDGTYSRVVKSTTRSLQVNRANMESYTEFNVADAESEDIVKERDALMAIYNALGGPEWEDCNWVECYNNNTPLKYWWNVNANDEGHVNRLYLSFFGDKVKGDLPAEYGNLKYLEEIFLYNIKGITSLPKEIGNLDLVKKILIFGTGITSLPDEVADMESLTSIEMYNAPLSSFPATISKAPALKTINLNNTNLTAFPEGLLSSSSLTSLNLFGNKLTGTLPTNIDQMTALEILNIGGTNIGGTLPDALGNMTNLKSLSLANNQFDGTLPNSLTNLTNLSTLDVTGNKMSGTVSTEFFESDMWGNLMAGALNPQQNGYELQFEGGGVPIEEIVLDEEEATVTINSNTTVGITILPKNATSKRLQIHVDDVSIANAYFLNGGGLYIYGNENAGITNMTVKDANGEASATIEVTNKGLNFKSRTINLTGNERGYKPEYVQYGDEKISWTSLNENVLTVDEYGVFTIKGKGYAEVRVEVEDVATYYLYVYVGYESNEAQDPEGFNRDEDGDWDN